MKNHTTPVRHEDPKVTVVTDKIERVTSPNDEFIENHIIIYGALEVDVALTRNKSRYNHSVKCIQFHGYKFVWLLGSDVNRNSQKTLIERYDRDVSFDQSTTSQNHHPLNLKTTLKFQQWISNKSSSNSCVLLTWVSCLESLYDTCFNFERCRTGLELM